MPHLRLALAAAAVSLLPAAVTGDPAFDPDTWWHLRVGQLVADRGAVPHTDPFSRLGHEQPAGWVAYSWLYERGLYEAHMRLGPAGVLWARTVLCALSTGVVLGVLVRRSADGPATLATAVLIGVALMPLMRERPWHLTIALTAATVAAVDNVRAGARPRMAWWLPPAFALWANLHIQFVLGWVALGLACLFPGAASRRALVALTAACVAATFANPYHVRLLGVVWEYATQTGPLRGVQELAPPDVSQPWTWAGLGLIAIGGVVVARRRPVEWFHVALLAVALVFMLRMRRDVWLAAVAAAAAVPDPRSVPVSLRWRAAVWAAVAAVFVALRLATPDDSDAANAQRYPVRAAEFVRQQQLRGPLFNPFSWGGYLTWALPEHPVSIDGRTNLYGSERVTRAMATWAGEPGWESDPDLRSAKLVIAPRRGALAARLRDHPAEWRVAFEDDTAVVFLANRGRERPGS